MDHDNIMSNDSGVWMKYGFLCHKNTFYVYLCRVSRFVLPVTIDRTFIIFKNSIEY